MTSESKILTVSYGTFSCTLEGFDNPFDTMKAIAEYFRDLAAQDRHFGAEPPPPDAAMLHRLAEREVSRLAAARAEEARLAPADAAEGPGPRIQINPVLRRPAQSAVPPAAAPEDLAEADSAAPEPALTDVIPDGVAAKLARIRRGVTPAAPVADAANPADADLSGPASDQIEDVSVTAFQAEAPLDPEAVEIDLAAQDAPHPAEDVADVAARLGELISSEPVAKPDLGDGEAAEFAADAEESWTAADVSILDAPDQAPEAEDIAATASDITDDAPLPVEIEAEVDEAPIALADNDDVTPFAVDSHPVEDDFTADDVALLAQLDGTVFDEESLAAKLDDTLPEDQPEVGMDLADAALQDPLPEAAEADTIDEAVVEDLAAAAPAEPEADPAAETPAVTGKAGARARRVNSRIVRIHPGEEPLDLGATRVLDNAEEASEIARLMQQADEVMAEEANLRRQEALSRLKAAVAATEADRADIDYEAPKAEA
ncbi:MAG TPA: hypothetical protein VK146_12225, partial [Tabrizicola sp.]|nr:hypothetical protein [Tabrizicola sp.]